MSDNGRCVHGRDLHSVGGHDGDGDHVLSNYEAGIGPCHNPPHRQSVNHWGQEVLEIAVSGDKRQPRSGSIDAVAWSE